MRIRNYTNLFHTIAAFLYIVFSLGCSTAAIISPCENSYKKETVYNRIKLPFEAKVNLIIDDAHYEEIIISQNNNNYVLKRGKNRFYSEQIIPEGIYNLSSSIKNVSSFYLELQDRNFYSLGNSTKDQATPLLNEMTSNIAQCLGNSDDWFLIDKKCEKSLVKIKVLSDFPKNVKAKLIDGDREIQLVINKQILLSSENKNPYLSVFTEDKSGQYIYSIKYEEECLPVKKTSKKDPVK